MMIMIASVVISLHFSIMHRQIYMGKMGVACAASFTVSTIATNQTYRLHQVQTHQLWWLGTWVYTAQ